MSEQAEIASLQEKIREEQRSAKSMGAMRVISIMLAVAMFFVFFGFNGGLESLLMVIMFVMASAFATVGEWSANRRKKELMIELEGMSVKIPTCPKCGKQIPKGNFEVCPFCGSRLTPPPPQ